MSRRDDDNKPLDRAVDKTMAATDASQLATGAGGAGSGSKPADPPLDRPLDRTMAATDAKPAAEGGFVDADTAKQPAVDANAPSGTPAVDTLGGTVMTMPGHGGATDKTPGARKAKATAPPPSGAEGDESRWVGKVFCGYKIIKKIAEGGMGVVYLGEHEKIGRRGAIKVLKLEYCQDDSVVERFYQEARSVNEIHHEGIVDIFDFGRDDDGRVFFVMEFLEGEPLSDPVDRGPLSFTETLHIMGQTCRALQAAHDKGFVHRDLKPENIWLQKTDSNKPKIKVLDFGIAKLVGMDNVQDKLTRTGAIIGTPHYMSPEQIDGKASIDHRSDIYSLGVILYELLTGKRPFTGETLGAIITAHLLHAPPPLSESGVHDLPPLVERIVERMLSKEPADRYDSVMDVLADLKDVAANRPPTKVTVLDKQRPIKAAPKAAAPQAAAGGSGKMIAAGLGVVAIAAAAFVVLRGGKDDKPAAPAKSEQGNGAPVAPAKPAALDYEKLRASAETLLSQSLADTEPNVRVRSADAAGQLQHEPSAPKLLSMLDNDPDVEVRGHAAGALGLIGYADALAPITKAASEAAPALNVWLAESRVRLGDESARKTLIKYATDKDLAVSFKAALALADVSPRGDKTAIKALSKLAVREAELNDIAPFAGVVLLTKTAALGDERSRDILHQTLDHSLEGARLAAAEGLARLGDESGKKVLANVLSDEGSSNRLVAARALVNLGDYTGFDLLTSKLAGTEPRTRMAAANGLGEIGEPESLRKLEPLLTDDDKHVRIASAVAILKIVGLAPAVLAQASVDWATGALASEDWAMRDAAAGVLGDIPEDQAVPLLAQAIADPEPRVRLTSARSAGKLKSPAAARTVADAARTEKDPRVKEEQVKSLGRIGSPVVKETLDEISQEAGPVGVFALGSLVAIGDGDSVVPLQAKFSEKLAALRAAAAEASVIANNPTLVPALAKGATDKDFGVRFTSAEGLAHYRSEEALAITVLQEGLRAKDTSTRGRALAALARLGQAPTGTSVEDMLRSPDPAVRLAAVPAIAQMPWLSARPLLRQVVADSDLQVRRAGIDAAANFAESDRQEVVVFYKPQVRNPDPVSAAKAKAHLSKLGDDDKAAKPAPKTPDAPKPAFNLAPVQDGVTAAKTALAKATEAKAALDAHLDKLDDHISKPAKDDDDVSEAKSRGDKTAALSNAVGAAAAEVATAATAVSAAAGTGAPPEAAALVAQAKEYEANAAAMTAEAASRAAASEAAVAKYVKAESGDADTYLQSAEAAIASGRLSAARRDLKKAADLYKSQGKSEPGIDYSYGALYEKQAQREKDDTKRLDLLKKAKASYDKFAAAGSGKRAALAKERSEELADDIADLAP